LDQTRAGEENDREVRKGHFRSKGKERVLGAVSIRYQSLTAKGKERGKGLRRTWRKCVRERFQWAGILPFTKEEDTGVILSKYRTKKSRALLRTSGTNRNMERKNLKIGTY